MVRVTLSLLLPHVRNTASIDAFSVQFRNNLFSRKWRRLCFRVGHVVLPWKHPSACGNMSRLTTDALLVLLLSMLPCCCCFFPHIHLSMWLKVHDHVLNIDHSADVKNKAWHPSLIDSIQETWQNQSEMNRYIIYWLQKCWYKNKLEPSVKYKRFQLDVCLFFLSGWCWYHCWLVI